MWVECSADNARRLVAVLDEFGFGDLRVTETDFATPDLVIQLGYEPNRVDLLTGLTGVRFEDAYPRRITGTVRRGGARKMTTRSIARVVRIARLGESDKRAERRAYWASRSIAERIAEVESLRRLWPEITGDPDVSIVRVVHKRRLGEPAPRPPSHPQSR